jgi:hypothetical protein
MPTPDAVKNAFDRQLNGYELGLRRGLDAHFKLKPGRTEVSAYSDDQPRGSDGRWGVGEGTPAPVAKIPKRVAHNAITMYHGTTTDVLQKIAAEGLKPQGGQGADAWAKLHPEQIGKDDPENSFLQRTPSVFMTPDPDRAKWYAEKTSEVHQGIAPILLKVTVPESFIKKNFQFDEADSNAIRTTATIPARYIKGYVGQYDTQWRAMPHVAPAAKQMRLPLAAAGMKTYYVVVGCTSQELKAGGPGSGRYPKGSHVDIGDQLARKISGNFAGAVKFYNNLPNTDGGRILNTDDARELSPSYRADRSRSAEVHEPASQFIKDLYSAKLAQATPPGRAATVLFTAGGTGAGKSSALRADPSNVVKNAEIIYDTNMNSVPSAKGKIEQALSSGRQVTVAFTHRDPEEALTHGALPRAMRMGRTVPLTEHLRTHVGSRNTVEELQKTYAENPKVKFTFIDNSRGKAGAIAVDTVDDLPKINDNGLEERLHEALEKARNTGQISETVYNGTIGPHTHAVGETDRGRTRQKPERAGTARASRGLSVTAGGPGSGRYPKGSSENGLGRDKTGRVFVSPNVEEGTNINDAHKALDSDRQKNFESKLRDIGSSVSKGAIEVHPTLGVWADGAENSAHMVMNSTDREARQYAGALAGKAANQKAVLDWENNKNGPHTLYAIHAKESGDTLNSKLGKAGIEFRTVEASSDGKSSKAYVLDQDGTLGDKIKGFAKDNGYATKSAKGTGNFVGSWDSRDEGRAEYDKIIQAYESKHPGKAYSGGLAFSVARASNSNAGGVGRKLASARHSAGWLGNGVRGNRRVQATSGQDLQVRPDLRLQAAYTVDAVQARLAKRMSAGMFRITDFNKTDKSSRPSYVTNNREYAESMALAWSSLYCIAQVYDHEGKVVYAAGGGLSLRDIRRGRAS